MNAKIIAITQPLIASSDRKYVKYEDYNNKHMAMLLGKDQNGHYLPETPLSPEEFIGYVARISNPANQNNSLTAKKLLKYLAKNKHWSPFEMVNIVMDINTTRDIARQILRHKSFSFQEFSQRYADVNALGCMHMREARLQDTKNRQNSTPTDDEKLKADWFAVQDEIQQSAMEAYAWAIQHGIAKEQARVVLPEGMTPSRLYVQGTLRSWIHYCDLRQKNGTQREHSDIAKEAWQEILKYFPSLSEVLVGDV